jgi:hypothetical protein
MYRHGWHYIIGSTHSLLDDWKEQCLTEVAKITRHGNSEPNATSFQVSSPRGINRRNYTTGNTPKNTKPSVPTVGLDITDLALHSSCQAHSNPSLHFSTSFLPFLFLQLFQPYVTQLCIQGKMLVAARLASTAALGEIAIDGGVDGAGGGKVLVGRTGGRGSGDAGRVGDLGQSYRMVVT